jgi:hypothetical protein
MRIPVKDFHQPHGARVKPDLDDVVFPEPLPAGGAESPPQDVGVVFEVPLGQHDNPLRCIKFEAQC